MAASCFRTRQIFVRHEKRQIFQFTPLNLRGNIKQVLISCWSLFDLWSCHVIDTLWSTHILLFLSVPMMTKLKIWWRQFFSKVLEEPNKSCQPSAYKPIVIKHPSPVNQTELISISVAKVAEVAMRPLKIIHTWTGV